MTAWTASLVTAALFVLFGVLARGRADGGDATGCSHPTEDCGACRTTSCHEVRHVQR